MFRTRLGLTAVPGFLAVLTWLATAQPEAQPPAGRDTPDPLARELEQRFSENVAPIMAQHCFACHGDRKAKADIRFEGIETIADFLRVADDLDFAREMVHLGDMPPEDEPSPTDLERLTIIQWIDDVLRYTPPDGAIDPGWFTIHRLNKAEYRNTLRDLLGVDPARVDLAAALPPDDTGYGFDNNADVLSMSTLQLELYLDAAERAIELGLGPVVGVSSEPRLLHPLEVSRPARSLGAGGYFLTTNAEVTATVDVPLTGDYEFIVEAWGTRGGDDLPALSLRIDGKEVGAFAVEAERGDTQACRVPIRLEAGPRRLSAAFTNDYWVPDVADRNMAIEAVSLAGPLSEDTLERPDAYREVMSVSPSPDANEAAQRTVARKVIGRFAARAFRRPLTDEEFRRLMLLYEDSRGAGDSYEEAVRVVLSAVLVSPNFLYRSIANRDSDDPDHIYELNDHELAARLSYFLWSSTPDDELTTLADRGKLADEAALRAQARRMLADPRADAFIENFAGQWLLLRNLERLEIDTEAFPEYSAQLRADLRDEATMFFGDIVRSDRSIRALLDSRETFLNARLASHYGVAGVEGDEFRRVTLDPASPRGGILTLGAVLTVTSNPTRTSPVKRGLYVLDQVLGAPPPPPPANIPRLEQSAAALPEDATPRQKLAAHLTDPTCVTCHRRMDPIGLSMENFDALGRWRDSEFGQPIDASGELPGGVRFSGPAELREIVLAREDDFVENLTRQVLTYALGRGLEPFDRPTVTRLVDHLRANDETFGALIEAVVASEAFRSCRGRVIEH
ncbi:MAG: DUF1592 domain-containing protein [Phycisphaerales bacterium JB041]